MVIDSHEHIMFPTKMQLDKMDEAGVDKTVLFCTAPHPEKAGTLNEIEAEMAALNKILAGSNTKEDNISRLKKNIAEVYGIGEFTPGSEQQIMQLETIFQALKNTRIYPVWVHTFHPVTMNGIKCLMSLCEKYPGIPVIFGHLGGSNWMDVIKFAKEHDDVYLDLSAAFASIAAKMALTELPERCLYSSDAPYGEPYLYRQLIEFVSPDKRAAEMALGENISRLLELH